MSADERFLYLLQARLDLFGFEVVATWRETAWVTHFATQEGVPFDVARMDGQLFDVGSFRRVVSDWVAHQTPETLAVLYRAASE